MPGNEIIHSLNPTLAYLLAKQNRDATFAIVATDGSGHYSKLSDAITAGANRVFIKDGSYTETSDITLTTQTIIGESRSGVILTLQDCSIKCDTSGDITQGSAVQTVKLANNSTLVTKESANDLTFNVVTPDENTRFYVDAFLARVTSITDQNNLDLEYKFFGQDTNITGGAIALSIYTLENVTARGITIRNMTINHFLASTNNCLEVNGTDHIIEDITFKSIQNLSTYLAIGKETTNNPSWNLTVRNCSFEGGDYHIQSDKCYMSTIENCRFMTPKTMFFNGSDLTQYNVIKNNIFSASQDGLHISGNHNRFIGNLFSFIQNTAIKIDKSLTAQNVMIIGNHFRYCGDAGNEVILSNTHRLIIINNTFFQTQQGIKIDNSSCESWIIAGNTFDTSKKTILITGFYHVIEANQFINSPTGETAIIGTSTKNTVTANQFIDIIPFDNLTQSTFSSNIIEFSTETAISISGIENNITGNQFIKTRVTFAGNDSIIKSNQFRDTSLAASFAITVTADRNVISCCIINTAINGIDIQATADKTHLTETNFINITTTAIQNNGTNTVQANNIT